MDEICTRKRRKTAIVNGFLTVRTPKVHRLRTLAVLSASLPLACLIRSSLAVSCRSGGLITVVRYSTLFDAIQRHSIYFIGKWAIGLCLPIINSLFSIIKSIISFSNCFSSSLALKFRRCLWVATGYLLLALVYRMAVNLKDRISRMLKLKMRLL